MAAVTQARQDWLEGVVVVIDFLQAQDVRSVGEDLFQDEVFPVGPAQGLQGALDKAVEPFTQSCGLRQ